MAKVVVVGGGVVGLCTGMLLANDGHEVTQLERDPATPPRPEDAWEAWDRKGVNQFKLLHYFAAGFREIAATELPRVTDALIDAGALHSNIMEQVPEDLTGGWRDGDERFAVVTARRPVGESAVASVAATTDGLTVRRGVAVTGLVTDETSNGVPHVVGVRTEEGEEIRADIVIDACGRRSAMPTWLADINARPLAEEKEDSGFIYYGRHFKSADGSVPPFLGPLLMAAGTVSILTLPADNGTWGIGLVTSAKDPGLRGLRDPDRWEAAVKAFPLQAHWLEGESIDDTVAVMAKIEDRRRSLVVDGSPVVTGALLVSDSWACTNPSLGRGISIGMKHALALRNHLHDADLADRTGVVQTWNDLTETTVDPWYRTTLSFDRHRLAEVESLISGEPYDPGDPEWELTQSLMAASGQDPDLFRAFLKLASVLDPPEVAFDDNVIEKALRLGAGWRDQPILGPSRDDLVKLAAG